MARKPKRGRPTKLCPAVARTLAEALAAGMWSRQACALAGIDRMQLYRWKAIGRAEREAGRTTVHTRFLDRIERADAIAIGNALSVIHEGGPTWKFHAKWLELKCPNEWGWRRRPTVGPEVKYEYFASHVIARAREDQ